MIYATSRDQDLAVWQQRRCMTNAGRIEASRMAPGATDRFVKLRTGRRSGAIWPRAPDYQDPSIGQ